MKKLSWCLLIAGLAGGCATGGNEERGKQDYVQIESSDPGVRIEANGDYIGTAPLTLKIFGDKDGTFHNFGSKEYTIIAYPKNPTEHQQSKIFYTGGWWSREDQIPKKIYFDMNATDRISDRISE